MLSSCIIGNPGHAQAQVPLRKVHAEPQQNEHHSASQSEKLSTSAGESKSSPHSSPSEQPQAYREHTGKTNAVGTENTHHGAKHAKDPATSCKTPTSLNNTNMASGDRRQPQHPQHQNLLHQFLNEKYQTKPYDPYPRPKVTKDPIFDS